MRGTEPHPPVKRGVDRTKSAYRYLGHFASPAVVKAGHNVGMRATMDEFKRGALHSGSKTGPVVQSRQQAIAIGLNQERRGK